MNFFTEFLSRLPLNVKIDISAELRGRLLFILSTYFILGFVRFGESTKFRYFSLFPLVLISRF